MAVNFYFQKGVDVIDIESAFHVRVTSVRGLNPPQPKEPFKRDWATEHGTDIYIPAERKQKEGKVTITVIAEEHPSASPMTRVESLCAYVFSDEIDYWDTLQKKKATLIYDSNNPVWVQFLEGNQKVMFELNFINPSGTIDAV